MYAGHVALALAGRRTDDDVPLAPFVAAAVLPDLFVDRSAHYLEAAPVLTALTVALVWRVWRSRPAALVCGALVLSHYAVDIVTGRLQMWTDGTRFGLRLYDRPLVDFVLEAVVIVAGWLVWRRRFDHADWRLPVLALVVLLGVQAGFDAVVAADLLD